MTKSSWDRKRSAIVPWQPEGGNQVRSIDVDALWKAVQKNVAVLQQTGRLPPDGYIYEPRQDVVREALGLGQVPLAEREAGNLARSNKAGGYAAFELLKEYDLRYGSAEKAAKHAATAAKLLAEAEKENQKRRKKRR